MIISFSVSNFRSIREEQTLDFTANSSNLKGSNLINLEDKKLRLLKSIVLYGANASGKTNLIRAFHTLRFFILNSTDLKKGDPFPYYDPFLLDRKSQNEPTTFKILFIAYDGKKYSYEVRLDKEKVIYEHLIVYETSQPSNLFLRENGEESVKIFEKFIDKKIDTTVLSTHLYLSKVGNSPNTQIGDLYLYFKDIEIWNTADTNRVKDLSRKIQELFSKQENELFQKRLSKLINLSDTKIDAVYIDQAQNIELKGLEGLPESVAIKQRIWEKFKFQTFGVHKAFEDGNEMGVVNFEFTKRESSGTQAVFAIGGLILYMLLRDKPGIIMFDEFDNSIHPELCRFLIELFQNPIVNKNNSQIAFATHETQLLDKDIFRKDQIWFVEKDKLGQSEFYSVADFTGEDNLREGIPFDKWYKLGKFGGIPHIKKTEFFAEYES